MFIARIPRPPLIKIQRRGVAGGQRIEETAPLNTIRVRHPKIQTQPQRLAPPPCYTKFGVCTCERRKGISLEVLQRSRGNSPGDAGYEGRDGGDAGYEGRDGAVGAVLSALQRGFYSERNSRNFLVSL